MAELCGVVGVGQTAYASKRGDHSIASLVREAALAENPEERVEVDYEALNATVIGISVDHPFVLNKWKEELGLQFTLLSDFNKTVCQTYGAYHEELGPLKGVAKRSVFIIDKAGILRYIWISDDPGKMPEVTEIQDVLDELK